MAITQKYESPDGLLRLLIERQGDETMVGFEGFSWHTHADLLTPAYGINPEEALRRFVDGLLADEIVIVISRVSGEVRDVWVTDAPGDEIKYASSGEQLQLRYWNGAGWDAA